MLIAIVEKYTIAAVAATPIEPKIPFALGSDIYSETAIPPNKTVHKPRKTCMVLSHSPEWST